MRSERVSAGRAGAPRLLRAALVAAGLSLIAGCGARAATDAPSPDDRANRGQAPATPLVTDDPRTDLRAGWRDPGTASRNMEHLANRERPEGFVGAGSPGDILFANSDMAYRGDLLFMGSFHGFQIWDISDPVAPVLRTAVVCPGGQGDLSVHGDLLFMSVEMPNARVDCGTGGSMTPGADRDRFMGVRIFDISDLDEPRQVGAVQTCRGSHTHTLVPDPDDASQVFIYVSGVMPARPAAELEGCTALGPGEDPDPSHFRIEVIRVPLDSPQDARIVSEPRIFAVGEDIAGLWPGGAHGPRSQETAQTDQCHDITAFPAIDLAAGACAGNGILLDISDPENPARTEAVVDPNFAYWHSASFNNDATTVVYTDEWGGGVAPRCQSRDPRRWGANALFTLQAGELRHRSYYKLPAAQAATQNCVAHNGSLVPVPGRDIMVQAWYQGGISVFDFTDPTAPYEIAYFDRGPLGEELLLGGFWSAYWYNGHIYGSEMERGLDVFRLAPSEHLSQNEIDAADLVRYETFNPQTQPRVSWPARFVVARAYLDQLRRGDRVPADRLAAITRDLDRAEALTDAGARRAALAELAAAAEAVRSQVDGAVRAGAAERAAQTAQADLRRLEALARTLREIP